MSEGSCMVLFGPAWSLLALIVMVLYSPNDHAWFYKCSPMVMYG